MGAVLAEPTPLLKSGSGICVLRPPPQHVVPPPLKRRHHWWEPFLPEPHCCDAARASASYDPHLNRWFPLLRRGDIIGGSRYFLSRTAVTLRSKLLSCVGIYEQMSDPRGDELRRRACARL